MKEKPRRITHAQQQVAADILCELEYTIWMDGLTEQQIVDFIKKKTKEYRLERDRFTHSLCTSKEAAESSLEYDRQTMIERYGHCDGLD